MIKFAKAKVASHTADTIRNLQVRTTVTELRSSFKLCNVSIRFGLYFVRIASLLSKRLRDSHAKELVPLHREKLSSLEALKKNLISQSVLNLPKSNGHDILDTDASNRQIGFAILKKGQWYHKNHMLLMSNTDSQRKEPQYDTSQMSHCRMGCIVITALLERMRIPPYNGSPCIAADHEHCRGNGKASPLETTNSGICFRDSTWIRRETAGSRCPT